MSVCLVSMPWQALESPSLPIGLLRSSAVLAGHPEPTAYHGSLRWAEFLLDVSDGEIGPPEYIEVAEDGLFHGLGDWVFTGVLHDDETFGVQTLREYASERSLAIDTVQRMRHHAADFVELVAREILDTGPTVVGFTSTFMQNVPSLAAAKRLKQLAPQVRVVFGGGNCDGPMGAAIHRSYPFVDFVVRGEGEVSWPMLLAALDGDGRLADVPGLCWRTADGVQRCNEQGAPLLPAQIPTPDFDDWFDRLAESAVNEYVEPKLVLESARGCWWGEKHHCTFCGLNGTLMQFRAKPADRMLAELTALVTRHRVLDVIMVDNIIDSRYFTQVLPRIAELGWDLRIHYEVKSNLKQDEISILRASGVAHVQPGIESLVSPVLRIMDKGVTGVRNVRTLRDCESAGLTTSWNWLYGFPGESAADYQPVLRQLPALVHLQPPAGASRILLERFSPYFENPALGFAERGPARAYRHVYSQSVDVHDMVYLFDSTPAGLPEADAKLLHELLDRWSTGYVSSSLQAVDTGEAIVIQDRRVGWPEREYRIDDPRLRLAYLELEAGRSSMALLERLSVQHHVDIPADELAAWLDELAADGLLFNESGTWITLPTRLAPIKVGS